MSMISAQCDELRSMAESVGLAVPQAATLMMEAADTILSLRDRAQDLQAENAKLLEACAELLKMAERHDPGWLHWPELHDELRKLGVKVVKL